MEGLAREKVSVITPAYNAERYIEETIKSVLNQTYQNLEMIIVDDCSTDKTANVIEKYMKVDDRIIYKKLLGNSGTAVVRNTAMDMASGRYIAFLDSDDLWDKNKLEKQISFMKKRKIAFLFTAYRLINEDGTSKNKRISVPDSITYRYLLKNTIIGCLTVVLDRNIIKNVKITEVSIGEDTATWLRILRENNIKAYGINEVLAEYRVRKESLSSNKVKAIKAMWRTYRECENINIIASSMYFYMYIVNAVKKRI